MASILSSVSTAVHDAAQALLDNEIPTKLSGLVNDAVTSGFGIVGDVLQIVVSLTATTAATRSPPTNPVQSTS